MRLRRTAARHRVGAHRRPSGRGPVRAENTKKKARTRLRQRVRLRWSVVAALGFAAVVVATSMPVSDLLTQHRQLTSTAQALAATQAADRSLTAEARSLSDPSTVAGLARSEYGLVPSGQKAYVILPPVGSSATTVSGSGHVPLGTPPVVPGSAESRELLGLAPPVASGGSWSASSMKHASASHPPDHDGQGTDPTGGFWDRVVSTLEFWR